WTQDLQRGHRFLRRLRAGGLGLNSHGLDSAAPIGGFKDSGIGRERGVEGIGGFVETKSVILPAGTPMSQMDGLLEGERSTSEVNLNDRAIVSTHQ
ncbi:MAG: aldehyde dehydrogenase, partial [Mycobacterium sp.]|nr:aldehyde dehydrogenase [Mycobacterium sp.]